MLLQNIAVLYVLYKLVRWVYRSHCRKCQLRKAVAILKKSGYKIYGAHRCGWCQKQLGILGDFALEIPFVDCAKHPKKCSRMGITSFPTWVDGDKRLHPGFKSLSDIFEISQRELSA